MNKFDLIKSGGEWLGKCRSWIQWNCINGSDVTWSSNDVLRTTHGNITVKDIEHVSAEVAAHLVTEIEKLKEKEQTINILLCDIKTLLLDVDTPTKEQRSNIVHRIAEL
jgi:hypothetical protein